MYNDTVHIAERAEWGIGSCARISAFLRGGDCGADDFGLAGDHTVASVRGARPD
jgi:hypothetical protein